MKIGIVSSYSDLCGNATYTKALQKEFEREGHTVEICDLKSIYFNTSDKALQKKGDELITEFCKKIHSLDYINLQIEQVLYGRTLKMTLRHISQLIDACKDSRFSLTFHSIPHSLPKRQKRGLKKIIYKIKGKFRKKLTWESVIDECIKSAAKKNGIIIVHNKRERQKILSKFPNVNVKDHPLALYDLDTIAEIKENFSKKDFTNRYQINSDKKYISCFGFMNENKSFETAIMALTLLPEEYCLCLWGGQHPLTFSWFPNGSEYTKRLLEIVIENKLENRVFFMGAQASDDDMLQAMLFSDYVVLPYLEVGRNASAIASIAVSIAENAFLSRNDCFAELKRYSGEAFFSFDMGNYMELAHKIITLPNKQYVEKNRKKFFENYNVKTNCGMYLGKGV